MTALGKITAVFVFLLSLIWFGLTAVVFNTRAEWKKEATAARKEANEIATAAENLKKQIVAERASNLAQLSAAKQTIDGLKRERDDALKLVKQTNDAAGVSLDSTQKLIPTIDTLQSTVGSLQSQNEIYASQRKALDEKVDTLALNAQEALRKANDAELQSKTLSRALEDKNEQIRAIQEAKQGAEAASGILDFRGDVLDVRGGDIIVFSGGLNAGVRKGMKFIVKRNAEPYYLGTLVVNIDPDTNISAGVFKPVNPLQTTGIYAPKKGDTITPDSK